MNERYALEPELEIVPASARSVKPDGADLEETEMNVKKQSERLNAQRTPFLGDKR